MNNDQITFDEVDLNYIVGAINQQLATTKWNVMDPTEWQQLQTLKSLEEKVYRALDGIYDEENQ
jgi:hypothetical protein